MIMDEIFKLLNPDNTVSLNRPLAHALGTNEAIIYSALIAKQLYYEKRGMLDNDGCFYSTIDDLQESTGLTRYQQDNAIKKLTDADLIYFRRKGVPARRFFRVNENVNQLKNLLEKGEEIMNSLLQKSNKQVCEKTTNKFAENSQTSLRETYKHTYNPNKETKVIKLNQSIPTRRVERIFQQRIVRRKNAPSISKLSGITSITSTRPKKKKSTRSLRLCSM